MASSSNQSQNSNRNRNRNRNRNHNRNRNRNNRSSNGGGSSQRRFVKQKVPRRTSGPSLWEKICSWLGLGPKRPSPPQRPSREKARPNPKKSPKKQNRERERNRNTNTKKSPPERIAVTSERLYVGNLPYSTKGEELAALFEKFGSVARSEIVYHRRSNRSKGYAFVEMEDEHAARKAADALHDHEFMGRKMIVNGAKSARPQETDGD